jgi:RNA polymerase sigma factor (sigma-70 family)
MSWDDALDNVFVAQNLAYKYRMFGYADMFQEAMIGMGRQPKFDGLGAIEPYLYARARTYIIDRLRVLHGRRFDRGREPLVPEPNDWFDSDFEMENVEVGEFLDRLDGRTKTIVQLRMQGYTQPEIGERLGISGSRVCQILTSLKEKVTT